jgi:hypothetical protein
MYHRQKYSVILPKKSFLVNKKERQPYEAAALRNCAKKRLTFAADSLVENMRKNQSV